MQVRVCSSYPHGQRSGTSRGITGSEVRGQAGWISECILTVDQLILNFYVSSQFDRKEREFSVG